MVIRMSNGRKKKHIIRNIAITLVVLLFLNIEMRPVQICHSSIFTTSENTEIKVHVLMNTLLPVDEEIMAKNIILEEQKINGMRNNPVYTVILYRS